VGRAIELDFSTFKPRCRGNVFFCFKRALGALASRCYNLDWSWARRHIWIPSSRYMRLPSFSVERAINECQQISVLTGQNLIVS